MARQSLDVGDFPKDVSAEELWAALKKADENMAEIYRLLGLVNMQNYVKKSGDTMKGYLRASGFQTDFPGGGSTFDGSGHISPTDPLPNAYFGVFGNDNGLIFEVPYERTRPAMLYRKEVLHTGNGGGEVEDVPVYSTVKILAIKPFRELYAELDRNVQVTLTLPEDADADFAPTVMFHTLHKGAGWKLSFTQGVRYYGGAAPTQVTADNTLTTWMFHYFKGIWTVAYNVAR